MEVTEVMRTILENMQDESTDIMEPSDLVTQLLQAMPKDDIATDLCNPLLCKLQAMDWKSEEFEKELDEIWDQIDRLDTHPFDVPAIIHGIKMILLYYDKKCHINLHRENKPISVTAFDDAWSKIGNQNVVHNTQLMGRMRKLGLLSDLDIRNYLNKQKMDVITESKSLLGSTLGIPDGNILGDKKPVLSPNQLGIEVRSICYCGGLILKEDRKGIEPYCPKTILHYLDITEASLYDDCGSGNLPANRTNVRFVKNLYSLISRALDNRHSYLEALPSLKTIQEFTLSLPKDYAIGRVVTLAITCMIGWVEVIYFDHATPTTSEKIKTFSEGLYDVTYKDYSRELEPFFERMEHISRILGFPRPINRFPDHTINLEPSGKSTFQAELTTGINMLMDDLNSLREQVELVRETVHVPVDVLENLIQEHRRDVSMKKFRMDYSGLEQTLCEMVILEELLDRTQEDPKSSGTVARSVGQTIAACQPLLTERGYGLVRETAKQNQPYYVATLLESLTKS